MSQAVVEDLTRDGDKSTDEDVVSTSPELGATDHNSNFPAESLSPRKGGEALLLHHPSEVKSQASNNEKHSDVVGTWFCVACQVFCKTAEKKKAHCGCQTHHKNSGALISGADADPSMISAECLLQLRDTLVEFPVVAKPQPKRRSLSGSIQLPPEAPKTIFTEVDALNEMLGQLPAVVSSSPKKTKGPRSDENLLSVEKLLEISRNPNARGSPPWYCGPCDKHIAHLHQWDQHFQRDPAAKHWSVLAQCLKRITQPATPRLPTTTPSQKYSQQSRAKMTNPINQTEPNPLSTTRTQERSVPKETPNGLEKNEKKSTSTSSAAAMQPWPTPFTSLETQTQSLLEAAADLHPGFPLLENARAMCRIITTLFPGLPIGRSNTKVLCPGGHLLATSIERITLGDHGPYAELKSIEDLSKMAGGSTSKKGFFRLWFPRNHPDAKVYEQLLPVDFPFPPAGPLSSQVRRDGPYADYKAGFYYISLFSGMFQTPMDTIFLGPALLPAATAMFQFSKPDTRPPVLPIPAHRTSNQALNQHQAKLRISRSNLPTLATSNANWSSENSSSSSNSSGSRSDRWSSSSARSDRRPRDRDRSRNPSSDSSSNRNHRDNRSSSRGPDRAEPSHSRKRGAPSSDSYDPKRTSGQIAAKCPGCHYEFDIPAYCFTFCPKCNSGFRVAE